MPPNTSEDWAAVTSELRAVRPSDALAIHNRVARNVARLRAEDNLPPHVRPLRVALLRSITAEVLAPSLVASLAQYDFAAEVSLGQLGNIAQEILRPSSFVYSESFDICVVLALAEHVLPELTDPSQTQARLSALHVFASQIEHLAEHFQGLVIVCNLAPPLQWLAPQLQAQSPESGRYAIDTANAKLARLAASKSNLLVCDLAGLAAQLGGDSFWSARDMLTSMQPFRAAAIPALTARLADLCLLYKAAPVKCIVLDCDNTLWGGIIGEDGLEGIQIGETYPGLCYQQFQRQLRDLTRMGFLLALNSKNNEADVHRVFAEHPGMVLKPEHFAAQRINWQDKASNMQALADDLNIGLDSFVFIDDSDFEINLIRAQLPQVRCYQVPAQPWLLPGLLPAARIVDRLGVTDEDRKKAQMYVQERQRKEFRQETGGFEAYLRGLDIRLTFEPFDPAQHTARVAQLTQKTNQFNLTTRRFTEAELLALAEQGAAIFMGSLSDRFGDYGRTALAIVQPGPSPDVCRLLVFLMSCRVIGRGVEDSFLRLVMKQMCEMGFRKLAAEFIPTARNKVSSDFLAKAGLRQVTRDADGRVAYEYDLAGEIPAVDDWITIR